MRSLLGAVLDRPSNAAPKQPGPPVPYTVDRGGIYGGYTTGRGHARETATYGQNGTVYATVKLYAQAFAMAKWHLYRQTATDTRLEDRPEVLQHQALKVWNNPMPSPIAAGVQLRSGAFVRMLSSIYQQLTGEAWLVVGKAGPIPTSLWPVHPVRMIPVPSAESFLAGYVYQAPDGTQVPLGLDEVLCVLDPNPDDPYRGMGVAGPLMPKLEAARWSAEYNRNFFLNSAEPGGVISLPTHLEDREFDELTARWRQQHQGTSKAHHIAVLEYGATWTATGSRRDMQFTEGDAAIDTAIRETMRIHGHMLGLSENVNLANAQAADYTFAKWGTELQLAPWQDMLNYQYLPLFGSTGRGVEFDHDSTVPRDVVTEAATFAQRLGAATAAITAGADPEEMLAAAELPPVKWTPRPVPTQPQPGMEPPSPEDTEREAGVSARWGGPWRPRP